MLFCDVVKRRSWSMGFQMFGSMSPSVEAAPSACKWHVRNFIFAMDHERNRTGGNLICTTRKFDNMQIASCVPYGYAWVPRQHREKVISPKQDT